MKKILLTIIPGVVIAIAAQAQNLRYFQFNNLDCGHGNWQDSSFIAATSDPDVISDVLAELSKPLRGRKLIAGAIAAGHADYNHNAGHWFKWHYKENEWKLADMAIEVCDGCPYSDIDGNAEYWLNNLRLYCPWSSQPMRELPMPTDVDDVIVVNDELTVYPNPASNVLNFKWAGSDNIKVYVVNTTGQVLKTAEMRQAWPKLDVSEFFAGVYFVKIHSRQRSISKTIQINK